MKSRKLYATTCVLLMVLVIVIAGVWLIKRDAREMTEVEPGASTIRAHPRQGHEGPYANGQNQLPADPESLIALLNTSIKVYGKVIDQHGKPVAGARVRLMPINRYEDSYGERTVITGDDGHFFAEGLYGYSLGISAEKEGYLRVPPLSSFSSGANLSYERDGSGTGNRHTDSSHPVILELLKIDPAGPIIHVGEKRWKLSLDGTPRKIALDSEEGRGAHEIEFKFTSDTHSRLEPGRSVYDSFDWSFEIRVPGGGLAWDRSDLEFEAPETGYKEIVRYEYSAKMPREEWKGIRYGRYFVKFADGTFGRIQFSIDGGSDWSPLCMRSWLSSKPGSRNLATEYMIINVIESEDPDQ